MPAFLIFFRKPRNVHVKTLFLNEANEFMILLKHYEAPYKASLQRGGVDSAESGLYAVSSVKGTLVTRGLSHNWTVNSWRKNLVFSIQKCPGPQPVFNTVSVHTKVFSYIIC